jgi:hypothetical protein
MNTKMVSGDAEVEEGLNEAFYALYRKLRKKRSYHVRSLISSQKTSPRCLSTDAGGEAALYASVLRIHGLPDSLQNIAYEFVIGIPFGILI